MYTILCIILPILVMIGVVVIDAHTNAIMLAHPWLAIATALLYQLTTVAMFIRDGVQMAKEPYSIMVREHKARTEKGAYAFKTILKA